jgi:hypothetical protein
MNWRLVEHFVLTIKCGPGRDSFRPLLYVGCEYLAVNMA